MDQSQTQKSLLQRAKTGDPLAWQLLTEIYRPFINTWARRHTLVEQDAEDLAQEILMELVTYLPGFEHNGRLGAFRSWLRTLAVHTTSRFWKSRKNQVQGTGDSEIQQSLNQLANDTSQLTKAWDIEHDKYILHRLLKFVGLEFEPQTMKVFIRLTIDEIRPEIIAAEMSLSLSSVYTARSRVLHRLKQISAGLMDWNPEG